MKKAKKVPNINQRIRGDFANFPQPIPQPPTGGVMRGTGAATKGKNFNRAG